MTKRLPGKNATGLFGIPTQSVDYWRKLKLRWFAQRQKQKTKNTFPSNLLPQNLKSEILNLKYFSVNYPSACFATPFANGFGAPLRTSFAAWNGFRAERP